MKENKLRGEIIYRRTYSRPLNEEGTEFETWSMTMDRVIRHQEWLWERQLDRGLNGDELTELNELRELLLAKKASVSGRTLWLGGTETAKKRECSQFNCSFLMLETVNDIVDQIWNLMNGVGVGFMPAVGILNGFHNPMKISVIRSELTEKLEGVDDNEEHIINGVWTIKVGDSAESWAKTFGKLLANKNAATELVLDFSNIRPAGDRLKGYGWISSGDQSLSTALPAICEIMNKKAGQLLNRIDLLDIGNWMGTVLSSRRSAEIALHNYGDPETEEFIYAKKDCGKDNPQRFQSNNSLVFSKKPTKLELGGIFDLMVRSGGSEPGFINGEAALKRAPWFKGVNPCFSGDMRLLTEQGYKRFDELCDTNFNIISYDGSVSQGKVWVSGIKPTVEVCISNRKNIVCTEDHVFMVDGGEVEAKDLKGKKLTDFIGKPNNVLNTNDFKAGFLIGDGTLSDTTDTKRGVAVNFNLEKDKQVMDLWGYTGTQRTHYSRDNMSIVDSYDVPKVRIGDRGLPNSLHNRDSLMGLFSANGCVIKKYGRISLKSTDKLQIEEVKRVLLEHYGINSYITTNKTKSNEFSNGVYVCKESYDLNIQKLQDQILFYQCINFLQDYKREALHEIIIRKSPTVTSVKPTGRTEKVYDFNEPVNHWGVVEGIVVHNCGEILLGTKSYCNLVEINLPAFNGCKDEELEKAYWLIGRANYRQTCVNLRDGVLQDTWHELNEFLRLTGVGVTGIVQWEYQDSPKEWSRLRQYAHNAVNSMADELGLPRSKAVTTVKPSGSLGKVMGVPEGIHKPLGKYIFNNVIFSSADPLVEKLRDAGYYMYENPRDIHSMIVRIPVKWDSVQFSGEMQINNDSAVKQLDRYKMVMENYVDHNCSITVSYDPSEVTEIINWLDENWDVYVGVSWLFRDDPTKTAEDLGYDYLPQEVVTEEIWENYVRSLDDVDMNNTNTFEEIDSGEECAGGVCPIK